MTGPTAAPEWDRFWRYDRLSSFETGPGSPNYGGEIADGWRAWFRALPDGARIVDLATGNGAIAVLAVETARDLCKSYSVTGVDAADIAPASHVTTSTALGKIAFLGQTPVEELPFADGSMDSVVSQFGIEYSDMAQSLPEAVRVLGPGGRLRLAMHAAEGAIVRDTSRSLDDADFLLEQSGLIPLAAASLSSLVAWETGCGTKEQAQAEHGLFRAALDLVERREREAMDRLMLASIRRDLIEAFNDHKNRRLDDMLAGFARLEGEVRDHRARQRALVRAALSRDKVEAFAARLAEDGLTNISVGEQRRGDELLAHVLEAHTPPGAGAP